MIDLIDEIYPAHNVYKDFKNIQYTYDITINFPWGCGGNFLANALLNRASTVDFETNTYKKIGHAYDFNVLDYRPLHELITNDDLSGLIEYLNRVYARADHMVSNKEMARAVNILIGHYPPWFFNRIVDYHTAEMVFIDLTSDTKWGGYCLPTKIA